VSVGQCGAGWKTSTAGLQHFTLVNTDTRSGEVSLTDARTGAVLWGYASGASVIAGASIVGDTVYWGSGYTNLGIAGFTGNNRFYAFSVNGR